MSSINRNKNFDVEIIKNGKRDDFGDRIYEYKIITSRSKDEVLNYCKQVIQPGYFREEKPTSFSPEIIDFKLSTSLGNTLVFRYAVKKSSTS